MSIQDNHLIEKILEGDNAVYEVLLKKYLKPVYNFLRTFVGDPAVLDDLTQETFIKAWKNIRRFDRKRNFKTWLFAIAKNTAYDFFKKKKTIPFSSFFDEEGNNYLENMPDSQILPDELLAAADIEKNFEKKLRELSGPYREILTLRYGEDFSLSEISEIIGVPYNTAKSRHQRALLALKKALMHPF